MKADRGEEPAEDESEASGGGFGRTEEGGRRPDVEVPEGAAAASSLEHPAEGITTAAALTGRCSGRGQSLP